MKPRTGITIICVATVLGLLLLWRPPNRNVPDDLLGEWHSSDPNYADRSFEIGLVSLSFGTGGGTVSTGFIKQIKAVPEGSRILYTITYEAEGTPNEVSFFYESGQGKVIRFTNQERTAWTKD